jgi:predicted nucleotidyltransferase
MALTLFDLLRESVKEDWLAISRARQETVQRLEQLRAICDHAEVPENTVVVFFGSLARGEWTSGSDVDWTLLV